MRRKETKTKVFIIPLQFLPVRYIIYCVKLIFDLRFLQREREKEMDLAKKIEEATSCKSVNISALEIDHRYQIIGAKRVSSK